MGRHVYFKLDQMKFRWKNNWKLRETSRSNSKSSKWSLYQLFLYQIVVRAKFLCIGRDWSRDTEPKYNPEIRDSSRSNSLLTYCCRERKYQTHLETAWNWLQVTIGNIHDTLGSNFRSGHDHEISGIIGISAVYMAQWSGQIADRIGVKSTQIAGIPMYALYDWVPLTGSVPGRGKTLSIHTYCRSHWQESALGPWIIEWTNWGWQLRNYHLLPESLCEQSKSDDSKKRLWWKSHMHLLVQ